MFATLQDRLPKELKDAGVTTLEAAHAFLRETYLPTHNRRFAVDPEEDGSAFVAWTGGDLGEILCHQEDRVVANVKLMVQVRRYTDGRLGLFHGPRCIGRYAPGGSPAKRGIQRSGRVIPLDPQRFDPGACPRINQEQSGQPTCYDSPTT